MHAFGSHNWFTLTFSRHRVRRQTSNSGGMEFVFHVQCRRHWPCANGTAAAANPNEER
jgi:hypothetical protein